MSDKTLYFVQPFAVRRHKLAAAGALTFRSLDEALATGAALARRKAGVLVLAQDYDPVRRMLLRPHVLRVYGQVPTEWTEHRVAA